MLSFHVGQKEGYAKYPCFIYLLDSRVKFGYWVRKDWLSREALVPSDCVILPSLHIKLELMKQFVKVLKKLAIVLNTSLKSSIISAQSTSQPEIWMATNKSKRMKTFNAPKFRKESFIADIEKNACNEFVWTLKKF